MEEMSGLIEPLEYQLDHTMTSTIGSEQLSLPPARSARILAAAHQPVRTVTAVLPADAEDERQMVQQSPAAASCCGTSNLRALWGMFLLNTVFAISQMIGSVIANSLSLFSDSGSMLVDTLAYMINIGLERRKNQLGADATKLWEVITSSMSVCLLVLVTIIAIADAAKRLRVRIEDDAVDGRLVMGFALGNLVMDIVMCANYFYQLRHRRKPSLKEQVMSETKEQLNMVAAFVHLFADTLRTLTGLIAGILEQGADADAVFIDAIATFIVCGAILLAAAFILYEAFQQYMEYRKMVRERQRHEAGIGEEGFRFRTSSSAALEMSGA